MVDLTPAQDWDPRSHDALEDQQATYDAMRDHCPVAHSDFFGWSVFKYEDVVAISQNPTNFSSGPGTAEELAKASTSGERVSIPLNLDAPSHTLYRRMMNPYFSAMRMRALEPVSRRIAVRLVEPMIASSGGDAVKLYADPYPVQSLCALLGWNIDDWRQIKSWTTDFDRGAVHGDKALLDTTLDEWTLYILNVVNARRLRPAQDITSWLLEQENEGRPLPDDVMVSILRLLLHAGHGTTTAAIGICIYHLAQDQALQTRLRVDPDAIPRAIEEILRFDGPLAAMGRKAKVDIDVRGRTIRKGERVFMMYLAANRDPEAFPNAAAIDIDRRPNRHLIWGSGTHTCVGMPVAKLELRVAIEELLARSRSFRLNPKTPLRRLRYPGNGFRALPVIIDPA